MSEGKGFKVIWFGLDRQSVDQQLKSMREKYEGRLREREKEIQAMKVQRNQLAAEVEALEEKQGDPRYEGRFYQLASERLGLLSGVLVQAIASDVKALSEKLRQKDEANKKREELIEKDIRVYKDQLSRLLLGLRGIVKYEADTAAMDESEDRAELVGPAESDEPALINLDSEDSISDITLKYQYALGRLAGEDLYDQSGQLIIGKGEQITEQALNRAEEENKMGELVVGLISE
jgi:Skp family chaperone for outer membrane proteins